METVKMFVQLQQIMLEEIEHEIRKDPIVCELVNDFPDCRILGIAADSDEMADLQDEWLDKFADYRQRIKGVTGFVLRKVWEENE